MTDQEYCEFVERAYHDEMMAQGVGGVISLAVILLIGIAVFVL